MKSGPATGLGASTSTTPFCMHAHRVKNNIIYGQLAQWRNQNERRENGTESVVVVVSELTNIICTFNTPPPVRDPPFLGEKEIIIQHPIAALSLDDQTNGVSTAVKKQGCLVPFLLACTLKLPGQI